MRSTSRLFMAAILLTVAAGVARAQDPVPPPPAPEVVQPPVVELPPVPVADPVVPVVETVPVVEPVPVVEAAVPVIVAPPPPEKLVVTTTTKRVTKKAKAPAEKPVIQEKPAVDVGESFEEAASPASAAAVDITADTPPPAAAASVASTAPAPPSVEVQAASVETKPEYTMGIGGWLLAGLAVAAFAVVITLWRRRRPRNKISIVDLTTTSPKLKPALAPRS